jgi:hypothetical protein
MPSPREEGWGMPKYPGRETVLSWIKRRTNRRGGFSEGYRIGSSSKGKGGGRDVQ